MLPMTTRRTLLALPLALLGSLALTAAPAAAQALPIDTNGTWHLRVDFGPTPTSNGTSSHPDELDFIDLDRDTRYPSTVVSPLGDVHTIGFKGSRGRAFFEPGTDQNLHATRVPRGVIEDGLTWDGRAAGVFRADVPANRRYAVRLYLGRLGEIQGPDLFEKPLARISTDLERIAVTSEDAPRLMQVKSGYRQARYTYRRIWREVEVGPTGAIEISFLGLPGRFSTPCLGLEIMEVTAAPPVTLAPGGTDQPARLVARSATNPTAAAELQPILTAMAAPNANYGQLRQQIVAFGQSPEPARQLLSAWAKAWWIGWLRGEEDMGWRYIGGIFFEQGAVDALKDELVQLSAPGSGVDPLERVRLERLYMDAEDYALGVRRVMQRAYLPEPGTDRPYPALPQFAAALPGTAIIFNPSAGEALLSQITGDGLSPTPARTVATSPFHAKAQARLAASMFGRNSHLGIDQFGIQFPVWRDELYRRLNQVRKAVSIDEPTALFKNAHGLQVLTWLVHTYGNDVGTYWDGYRPYDGAQPPLLPGAQPWWLEWTAPAGRASSGTDPFDWATEQRRMALLTRAGVDWFRQRRLFNIDPESGAGALGGGDGDDIELIAGATLLYKSRGEDPADPTSQFVLAFNEWLMTRDASPVDLVDVYWNEPGPGVVDVEHAAEFSSLPIINVLATRPGDADFLDYALRATRNLDEVGNPRLLPGSLDPCAGQNESWTEMLRVDVVPPGGGAPVPRDVRVFKDFTFDACDVGTNLAPFMGTETTKALLPALRIAEHSRHPAVQGYLAEIGAAWHEAALTTGPTLGSTASPAFKPRGIVPSGFNPVTGEIGLQGDWFETPLFAGTPQQYLEENYEMMAMAAEAAADPCERIRIYRTIYDGIVSAATEGLDLYDPPFNRQGEVALVLERVAAQAAKLQTTFQAIVDDPSSSCGFVPDMALIANFIASQGSQSGGAGVGLIYRQITDPALAIPARLDAMRDLAQEYRSSAGSWQNLFPVVTQFVSYTDSVASGTTIGRAISALSTVPSGERSRFVQTPVVRWFDASTGGGLAMGEASIMVTDVNPTPDAGSPVAIRASLFLHGGVAVDDARLRMVLLGTIPRGEYVVRIGIAGGDPFSIATPLGTVPTTGTLTYEGGIQEVELPLLPRGERIVVEVELVAAGAGTSPLLPDLALSRRSLEYVPAGAGAQDEVRVEILNVGAANYIPAVHGPVDLIVRDAAGVQRGVASDVLAELPYPVHLECERRAVVVPLAQALVGGERFTVEIVGGPGLEDITALNNAVGGVRD